MDFYFNLITERSAKNPQKYPLVYTFSQFFFKRGAVTGRFERKYDFFSYDILIIPILHKAHWRLVVSYF